MADYTVQDLQDNLNYLNETKSQIKQAIIEKGQPITDEDTFRSYANKIENIETGVDTSDANATSSDLLVGKTAYIGEGKITGTIIGALIIGVLSNALNILDVSSYYQMMVKGAVILVAVLLDRKSN